MATWQQGGRVLDNATHRSEQIASRSTALRDTSLRGSIGQGDELSPDQQATLLSRLEALREQARQTLNRLERRELAEWFSGAFSDPSITPANVIEKIRDGRLLCELAKQIEKGEKEGVIVAPYSVKNKWRTNRHKYDLSRNFPPHSRPQFPPMMRENIAKFLDWCKHLGVPSSVCFEPSDIVDAKDSEHHDVSGRVVQRKNEESILPSLMELARIQYGIAPPPMIELERKMQAGERPQITERQQDEVIKAIRQVLRELDLDPNVPIRVTDDLAFQIGDNEPIRVAMLRDDPLAWDGHRWDTLKHFIADTMAKKQPPARPSPPTRAPSFAREEDHKQPQDTVLPAPAAFSDRSVEVDDPHKTCRDEIDALRAKIEELKKLGSGMSPGLKQRLEELEQMAKHHNDLEKTALQRQHDKEAAEDETHRLRSRLADTEQALEDARQQFIEQRVKDAGAMQLAQHQAAEEAAARIAALERQLLEAEKAKGGSLRAAEEEIDRLHKELDATEDRAQETEESLLAKLAQLQQQSQQQLMALQQQLEDARRQGSASSDDVEALQRKLAAAEGVQSQLQDLLEEERAHADELQAKLDEAEEQTERVEEEADKQLLEQIKRMEQAAAEKLAALETEKQDAINKERARQLKHVGQQRDALQKQIDDEERAARNIQRALDAAQREGSPEKAMEALAQAAEHQARIQDLKQQQQQLAPIASELLQAIQSSKGPLNKDDLAQARKLQSDLDRADARINALVQSQPNLKEAEGNLASSINQATQPKIDRLEKEVARRKQAEEDNAERMKKLQQELADVKAGAPGTAVGDMLREMEDAAQAREEALQAQISDLESELQKEAAKNKQLSDRTAELEGDMAGLQEKLLQTQRQLEDADHDSGGLAQRCALLEEQLREQSEHLRDAKDDAEMQRAENAQLEARMAEALKAAEQREDELRGKLDQMQRDMDGLASGHDGELLRARQERDEAQARNDELEKELERAQKERDAAHQKLQQDQDGAQADLRQKQQELEDAARRASIQAEELERLQGELAKARGERDEADRRLAQKSGALGGDLEKAQARAQAAEAEAEQALSRLREAQAERDAQAAQLAKLAAELEGERRLRQFGDEELQKRRSLEDASLGALSEAERKRLQDDFDHQLRRLQDQLADIAAQRDREADQRGDLEQRLKEEKELRRQDAEKHLHDLNEWMSGTGSAKVKHEAELAELKRKLEADAADRYMAKMTALADELEAQKRQGWELEEGLRKKIVQLEGDKEALQMKCARLQDDADGAAARLKDFERDMAALRERAAADRAELEAKLRDEHDARLKDREQHLAERAGWIDQTEDRARKAEAELADLRRRLEADADAKITALERQRQANQQQQQASPLQEELDREILKVNARAAVAADVDRLKRELEEAQRDLRAASLCTGALNTEHDVAVRLDKANGELSEAQRAAEKGATLPTTADAPIEQLAASHSSVRAPWITLLEARKAADKAQRASTAAQRQHDREPSAQTEAELSAALSEREATARAVEDAERTLSTAVDGVLRMKQQSAQAGLVKDEAALKRAVRDLQDRLAAVQAASGHGAQAVEALQGQLDDERRRHGEDRDAWDKERGQLKARIAELEAQVADLEAQLAALRRQVSERDASEQELQRQLKEREALAAQKANELEQAKARHASELELARLEREKALAEEAAHKEAALQEERRRQQEREAAAAAAAATAAAAAAAAANGSSGLSQEEQVMRAYREEIAAWINAVTGSSLRENTLLPTMRDGKVLCLLAQNLDDAERRARQVESQQQGPLSVEARLSDRTSNPDPAVCELLRHRPLDTVVCDKTATPGSGPAADNIRSFIAWTRELGLVDPDIFSVEDVDRQHEREVLFGLFDVARSTRGAAVPPLVDQERDNMRAYQIEQWKKQQRARSVYNPVRGDVVDTAVSKVVNDMPMATRLKRVGQGRYVLDGETKVLLVRVLRSTVMVRVGGGWEELRTYLMTHDKSRIFKTRTVQATDTFESAMNDADAAVEEVRQSAGKLGILSTSTTYSTQEVTRQHVSPNRR